MKAAFVLLSLTATSWCIHAESGRNALPSDRFVVVGDSLSAGVQNFSLLDSQQPNSYASVIAKQAGWPLTLPLVPYPGAPNQLQVVTLGPPVDIQPVPGSLIFPRDNPFVQPTNVAVPGLNVGTALTLRPDLSSTNPVQQWATIVLGFPAIFQGKAPTEIEAAVALKPTIMIEWLGNNDALVPALTGQLSTLTPVDQFAADYQQVLDTLTATGAKLITATVPDVTEIAYFTSASTIALESQLPLSTVTAMLGIGPNDFVRPSAQAAVDAILSGKTTGPLPASCPSPLTALGVTAVPCVLTQDEALMVRQTVNCYNTIIETQTAAHGGVLVDVNALVSKVYASGYQLGNQELSTNFFGGLFSLDGIHPSNT
ncbi:MAG TPA: hypothetical protein VHZ55_34720, partial [Bryobacteraceae bacterium]|nr:hypothetical protein [Bryobacteraceae bacterium]